MFNFHFNDSQEIDEIDRTRFQKVDFIQDVIQGREGYGRKGVAVVLPSVKMNGEVFMADALHERTGGEKIVVAHYVLL